MTKAAKQVCLRPPFAGRAVDFLLGAEPMANSDGLVFPARRGMPDHPESITRRRCFAMVKPL